MIKFAIYTLLCLTLLAAILSLFLQKDDFALCPWNDGEPVEQTGCEPADAIVAISGGDTNARTDHAVDLYKHGWAKYIIFSGAAEDKSGPSNAQAMRLRAANLGVPATNIIIEERSNNTQQNAENTEELLEYHGISSVILVTSGYHQRRASIEFGRATKDMNVEIRNSPSPDKSWSWHWWLSPKGWYLAVTESGKSLFLMMGGKV